MFLLGIPNVIATHFNCHSLHIFCRYRIRSNIVTDNGHSKHNTRASVKNYGSVYIGQQKTKEL